MSYTKESLPTRPDGIDGAITDGVSDGAWTEEPVEGAYTYIGYDKEFKPFTRYTFTKESVPSSGWVVGDAIRGAVTEIGTRGASTEPPTRGAYTDFETYSREIKPTFQTYGKESVVTTSFTEESKPDA